MTSRRPALGSRVGDGRASSPNTSRSSSPTAMTETRAAEGMSSSLHCSQLCVFSAEKGPTYFKKDLREERDDVLDILLTVEMVEGGKGG